MREQFLKFSVPSIGEEEIAEITDSLKSGWLTTGPKTKRFEEMVAEYTGAKYALAVNSGTAGLHISLLAAGIGEGDEVITTSLTWAATANMIATVGAKPVFVDIEDATLNIDPQRVAEAITPRTKAILPVHFAGLPCDMAAIAGLARERNLVVIEDAAHAIGTEYDGQRVGNISDLAVFSFHPIKNITTGEGGAVTTNNDEWAQRMKLLRFHGVSRDSFSRASARGSARYDVECVGYKYNMLDLQAALGIHQLAKLDGFIAARRAIARRYDEGLADLPGLKLPTMGRGQDRHAWHLYVVRPQFMPRDDFMNALADRNIGTGLHFLAVHMSSYYQQRYGYQAGDFPVAEAASEQVCSLPLFPDMTPQDAEDVIAAVKEVVAAHG